MAYTDQQIYDAMVASAQQGFSNADIMAGLAKYGVDPQQAASAYQTARPDLFAQPDEIMANVTAGNYAANTNDPEYQALTRMEDYARSFAPAPTNAGSQLYSVNNGQVVPSGGGPAPGPAPAPKPAPKPAGGGGVASLSSGLSPAQLAMLVLANRSQTAGQPITQRSQIGGDWRNQTTGYGTGKNRAGAGGIDYFNKTTYTPLFAEGGAVDAEEPAWLKALNAIDAGGSGYDAREYTDPNGRKYNVNFERTDDVGGGRINGYRSTDGQDFYQGQEGTAYDPTGKETGKYRTAPATDFDMEDLAGVATVLATVLGGDALLNGLGAGAVGEAAAPELLGEAGGYAAGSTAASAAPELLGEAGLAGEATGGAAGEVLSKAALDGTNIFGANSLPGALDISSLSNAAAGANAADALTSITKGLGYTTPVSLLDSLKKVPGIGTLTKGLTGAGEGGLGSLLPLLLLMGLLGNKGGSGGTGGAGQNAKIPALKANRSQTPYAEQHKAAMYAQGGGIAALGGRHLKGPGDGTSDSIPALIDGSQPAALARDEFVVDARTVSELGNGSSEAGAEKLYKMMDRVHAARKKAKTGQDTHADRYLPA